MKKFNILALLTSIIILAGFRIVKGDFLSKVFANDSTFLAGDVNGNGYLDVEDVRLVYKGALTLITLTKEQLLAADVDCDGSLSLTDGGNIFSGILEQEIKNSVIANDGVSYTYQLITNNDGTKSIAIYATGDLSKMRLCMLYEDALDVVVSPKWNSEFKGQFEERGLLKIKNSRYDGNRKYILFGGMTWDNLQAKVSNQLIATIDVPEDATYKFYVYRKDLSGDYDDLIDLSASNETPEPSATPSPTVAGDVDGDGTVTLNDAQIVLKKALNIIP